MDSTGTAVVAGHLCLDITPLFPPQVQSRVSDILRPGQLIHMDGVNVHIGGAVANTGLALQFLGIPVRLVGKIGDDAFGALVRQQLAKYAADGHLIVSDDSDTSYSIVLAVPGIDRIFLHDAGANDTFCAKDLSDALFAGASLFHFGYPPLMQRMYADGGKELVQILTAARQAGAVTSLDMAAVDPEAAAGRADWETVLRNVLPLVDFFVPSAEEVCWMLDRTRFSAWKDKVPDGDVCSVLTPDDVRILAQRILDFGAGAALIKCGAAGLYCRTAGPERLARTAEILDLSLSDWASQEIFEASYVPDAVISGTGAGDTCIAGFLYSAMEGETLAQALHMAAAQGACCVAAYDALSGLRPPEEVREKIASGWKKQENPRFSVMAGASDQKTEDV